MLMVSTHVVLYLKAILRFSAYSYRQLPMKSNSLPSLLSLVSSPTTKNLSLQQLWNHLKTCFRNPLGNILKSNLVINSSGYQGKFWFTTNNNVKVLRYWYTVPCNYKKIPNLHSTAFWIILLISTRAKLVMSLHPSMYLVFNHKPFTFWRVALIVLLYNIRFFQLILLHRSETSCVHHHLQEVFGGWHNVPHHPLHQVRRWWIHGRRWTHSKKNNLRIPGYLTIRGAFSSKDYTRIVRSAANTDTWL